MSYLTPLVAVWGGLHLPMYIKSRKLQVEPPLQSHPCNENRDGFAVPKNTENAAKDDTFNSSDCIS